MSALRREEPSPTTDAASQKWASVGPARTDVMDQANVDPEVRRPPQSVASTATDQPANPPEDTGRAVDDTTDDTYDGEILSSTVDPVRQAPVRQAEVPRATQQQSGNTATAPRAPAPQADGHLFNEQELRDFRARWDQVQTTFVDDPRHAVELADALVGTVVKRIADQFSEERANMEKQWGRGENVSTEELRQNFKRYRAFFDRLLAF